MKIPYYNKQYNIKPTYNCLEFVFLPQVNHQFTAVKSPSFHLSSSACVPHFIPNYHHIFALQHSFFSQFFVGILPDHYQRNANFTSSIFLFSPKNFPDEYPLTSNLTYFKHLHIILNRQTFHTIFSGKAPAKNSSTADRMRDVRTK